MNMPLVLLNRRRRGFTAFSPSTLFSSGSQGIWLDPSDLSTMFSDRAGATPVTTPGTVVGLRLDKSKGLALGSQLVSNPGPFTVTTGWTGGNSASVAISGSKLRVSGNGVSAFPFAYAAVSTVVGRGYAVSAIATFVSGSNDNAYLEKSDSTTGSSNNLATATGPARTITFYFTATATTTYIRLGSANNNDVNDWDNISVRELAGNHATAPTDAARPIYGVEPKGGRRNLLTYSEQFDNAAWAKSNATVPPTQYLAPDGTTTADALFETTATGFHSVTAASTVVAATAGQSYTFSFYLKANGRTKGFMSVVTGVDFTTFDLTAKTNVFGGNGTSVTVIAQTITELPNGWFRLTSTVSISGNVNIRPVVGINNDSNASSYAGDASKGFYLWGAQLELGSTATNYQRVTNDYDVTEAGVATCHYVQYDGSDDSMSTAAIDFTATDKMSVFAGVRKLSDAASGVVVESGTDVSLVGGSFLLAYPRSGSVNAPSFLSRGTSTSAAISSSNAYPAPRSSVITGTSDISGDLTTLRENGTSLGQATTDLGTGNFGSYPLYIGRRNNASLPFNGRDYGLIVVGKAASAGEITDTETWLAARTSGVTL